MFGLIIIIVMVIIVVFSMKWWAGTAVNAGSSLFGPATETRRYRTQMGKSRAFKDIAAVERCISALKSQGTMNSLTYTKQKDGEEYIYSITGTKHELDLFDKSTQYEIDTPLKKIY